jgi:sugar phosphate isomerase/epimerase
VTQNEAVSRRAFLAAAAVLPAAMSAVAIAAQTRPFKVGLQLYSVRNAYGSDMPGAVTAVAKMGYEEVEFWSPYMQWDNARAKEARQLLDGLGIACPSTHNPASSLSGDGLKRAIELNQILGSRTIVAASAPPKLVTADAWTAFADTCAQASETLRPLGMRAGFHNHAAEWRVVEGRRPMDILAAGTPRDFVLQLDIGTCVQAGQDPVAWINAHPGRIASMHCKDWGAGEGRGYAVAFAEGDAPWLRIFQAAESVGGIEHYFLEQEVPGPIGELAMVQKCLENYRTLRGVKT